MLLRVWGKPTWSTDLLLLSFQIASLVRELCYSSYEEEVENCRRDRECLCDSPWPHIYTVQFQPVHRWYYYIKSIATNILRQCLENWLINKVIFKSKLWFWRKPTKARKHQVKEGVSISTSHFLALLVCPSLPNVLPQNILPSICNIFMSTQTLYKEHLQAQSSEKLKNFWRKEQLCIWTGYAEH